MGDKVNIARHTLDAGGLTVGYVVRVYPTTVDVLFPPDEYHVKGWTNEEEKEDLIYAGHDNNWRNVANEWLKEEFYADTHFGEIQVGDKPPTWTELIAADERAYKRHIGDPSPIPITANVWTESDAIVQNLEYMIHPFLLYDEPITLEDIEGSEAITGFQPMTTITRRRL